MSVSHHTYRQQNYAVVEESDEQHVEDGEEDAFGRRVRWRHKSKRPPSGVSTIVPRVVSINLVP